MYLFDMSPLGQESTNLPMIIWVGIKAGKGRVPRINVAGTHSKKIDMGKAIRVSIQDEPKTISGGSLSRDDLELVKKFICLNKPILLRYWNLKISTIELIDDLRKV